MDIELLKTFAQTEKTLEDIDLIMSMTQGLPFVINYNNVEIHKLICQNMTLATFKPNTIIYDSSLQDNEDYLIYSGEVDLFSVEKEIYSLIREIGSKDCFGSFEMDIMKKNASNIKKLVARSKSLSKILVFKNKKNENAPMPKTRREVFLTQREFLKRKYDPDIFIFDKPEKINDIVENTKKQIKEDFKYSKNYGDILKDISTEKEFNDIKNCCYNKKDLKDIFNYVEEHYGDEYVDEAILDLKFGMLIDRDAGVLPNAEEKILSSLDVIKNKFYDKDNHKNRNLIQLNIENEIEKQDFEDYIYNEICKTKNLDELKLKKKKNDVQIEHNKKLIKKDENLLLNTYYCIYCHIRPRDVISDNCNHLVICEECMKKTKICPRCGMNINSYHKIFRS